MTFQHQTGRSLYGHCNSYFVESDDNGVFAQREEARRQARATAREVQRQLAEELSNVTCDEYQDEILDHMEQMESATLPDVNFIEMQTEIQWNMRPYLLDFLVEAHASFQLLPETLYLAVNVLDRYCSKRVVYKRHYQLVGCAALLIAAKYGDRKDRVPTIKELRSMCCSVYEEEMFTQMEWHVLVTLNWTIGHPTVDSFLQIILSEEVEDPQVEYLTGYICEMALYHRDFVSMKASIIAKAGVALARCVLSREVDNARYWSGDYDRTVFMDLYRVAQAPSRVLSQKYSTPALYSVAQTLDLFNMRQAQIAQQNAQQPVALTGPAEDHVMTGTVCQPQTPQKGQQPPGPANGYLTPPVTPENSSYLLGHKKQGLHGQPCVPSVYTPPPSAEQPRHLARHNLFAQYSGSFNHSNGIVGQ